jgi:pimeloyl-ACP methyl ester carboxylesterase
MKTLKFAFHLLVWVVLPNVFYAQQGDAISTVSAFTPGVTPSAISLKTIRLSTGVQLEYAEQGDPGGVPVILLHGFTDSWTSFAAVLPQLPPALHVFALSQRGHGNSSKPAGNYRPEDFTDDLAAFIKQRDLSPAVVVGHSMGSTNAQSFATRYPELTRGLVLVASFADFDKPAIHEFKKVIDELRDPVDSSFIAEFQKSTLTRPIPGETLQTLINESRKLPAHVWKGVAAGWSAAGYSAALTAYEKPVLIIWGDRDAYCPEEDQQLLHRSIRNSRLLIYEGTGHANHWEEPQRFAKDLAAFALPLRIKNKNQ